MQQAAATQPSATQPLNASHVRSPSVPRIVELYLLCVFGGRHRWLASLLAAFTVCYTVAVCVGTVNCMKLHGADWKWYPPDNVEACIKNCRFGQDFGFGGVWALWRARRACIKN